jgi:coproporphyrinogen III oxidase-like Fe-S oxidoreductase
MSREMARALADAGCTMVRVGVQTVNSDTLADMDRKGTRDRVGATVDHLREFAINYSLDHILGLPGEGPRTNARRCASTTTSARRAWWSIG